MATIDQVFDAFIADLCLLKLIAETGPQRLSPKQAEGLKGDGFIERIEPNSAVYRVTADGKSFYERRLSFRPREQTQYLRQS